MDVPQKVKDIIAKKILENEKLEEDKLKAQEAEKNRLEKIRCMRVALEDDLLAGAQIITDWLFQFWNNPEIQKGFKVRRSICVFGERYFDGAPTTDRHAWAVIEAGYAGTIKYCERRNTSMGSGSRRKTMLGVIVESPFSDAWQLLLRALIDNLHPQYLLQFAEAVKSGKVWDYVERSLR